MRTDCSIGCDLHDDEIVDILRLALGAWEIHSTTHEAAAVVSCTLRCSPATSLNAKDLVTIVEALGNDIENAGWLIGHVKACGVLRDGNVHVSMTGTRSGAASETIPLCSSGQKYAVDLVAIALGPTKDELALTTKAVLRRHGADAKGQLTRLEQS